MKPKKEKSGITRTMVIIAIIAIFIGLGPRGVRYALDHSAQKQQAGAAAPSAENAKLRTSPSSNGMQLDRPLSDYQVIVENDLLKPLGWYKIVETAPTPSRPMVRREIPRDPPKPLNYLMLTGITYLSEEPMALIEDVSGGESYYLRKGEKLKDYVVADIEEENIVLVNGNSKFTATLGMRTYYNANGGLLTTGATESQFAESPLEESSEGSDSLGGDATNLSLIERMRARRRSQLE